MMEYPSSTAAGQKPHFLSNLQKAILLLALAAGFCVRVVDLKDPPLDFHATRQLRSAIIARSFYYQLNPNADPVLKEKAVQLGKLEIYEPPILEALVGFTDTLAGGEYFWLGRIYNALFWCLGGLALFGTGRHFLSFPAAMTGLLFYLCLPFSVIASRSFQPDAWMVMWVLFTFHTLVRWGEEPGSWKWAILAGLAAAMALLVKLFAVFFIAPVMLAVFFHTLGWRGMFRRLQPWAAGLLAVLPSVIYYLLINTQRSSDFFSFWVISLSGLILQTNFYADWLAMIKGLMGLVTLVAALLGVISAAPRLRTLLTAAWVGYLVYGLIFPYQYITHEYYHLPLVGLTALSLMPLADLLFRKIQSEAFIWKAAASGVLIFASFYGLYVSRSTLIAASYELEPASWKRVGDSIPDGKPFIALTADYGMRLNYYGWKQANDYWPSTSDLKLFAMNGSNGEDTAARFLEMTEGKDYFLVTALSELDAQPLLKEILTGGYTVAVDGNGFILYDLTRQIKGP